MLAALVCVPGEVAADPDPSSPEDPVRIMLVGDSVTHGSTGDWTWRYRLAEHLDAVGVQVDLVGPRDDLYDYRYWFGVYDHEYVAPDFDQDHAAHNGSTATGAAGWDGLVETYDPDVIVEMLGINDLVFLERDPEELRDEISRLVASARAADPDVDVVLAHAPQTWLTGQVDEFNALVTQLAGTLSTPESRVVAAATAVGLEHGQDTWDIAHANSWGEVKIAAAVADSLAELGIGSPYPRPLPTPPRGPRTPPALTALDGDGEVTLSWTRSPGADSTQVSMRDLTAGGDWQLYATVGEFGNSLLAEGLPNGHRIEWRVLPAKGYWAGADDVISNVVATRPRPGGPGEIGAVVARARPHGTDVTWQAAPYADSYLLWWRNVDAGTGWESRPVEGEASTIADLEAGATYEVAVQPVGRTTAGARSAPVAVVPSGPVPRAVRPAVSIDRSGLARITWRVVPDATRYTVTWRRTGRTAWRAVPQEVVGQGRAHVDGLVPRRAYEFSVRPFHMRVPGLASPSVTAVAPPVRAVRVQKARRLDGRTAKVVGREVPHADGYRLAVARVASCAEPRPRRLHVRLRVHPRPVAVVRVPEAAVWVSWTASRDGVPGAQRRWSSTCLPGRR